MRELGLDLSIQLGLESPGYQRHHYTTSTFWFRLYSVGNDALYGGIAADSHGALEERAMQQRTGHIMQRRAGHMSMVEICVAPNARRYGWWAASAVACATSTASLRSRWCNGTGSTPMGSEDGY